MDVDLASLAGRQRGLIRYGQLLSIGVTTSGIRRRVQAGRLHRLYRGVYAVGHVALSRGARELAAVWACGPYAVLSHRSAAALWGLFRAFPARIEVSAPRSRGRRAGMVVHRTRCLAPEDRTEINGIPVTSLARTLVDLAEVVSPHWLARAVHEAEVKNLFDLKEIDAALARVPGRRGRHRLQRVLALYRPLEHELRSANERRFLALCRHQELPEPAPRLIGGYLVDFYWEDASLAIEVDGAAVHHTRRAFHEDRARDRALAAHGVQVLRVTEPDLDLAVELAAQLREVRLRRLDSTRTARAA